MRGAIPLLPLYAFGALTKTYLFTSKSGSNTACSIKPPLRCIRYHYKQMHNSIVVSFLLQGVLEHVLTTYVAIFRKE